MYLPCAYQNMPKSWKFTREHSEAGRDNEEEQGEAILSLIVMNKLEKKWGEDTEGRCWFEWEMTGTVAKLQPQIEKMVNEQV